MTAVQLVFIIIVVVLELVIGIRLIQLARRSRGWAESFWGWAWVLDALSQAGAELAKKVEHATVGSVLEWFFAGMGSASIMCLGLGIWLVFRPEERAVRTLLAFALSALSVTYLTLMVAGDAPLREFGVTASRAMTWTNRSAACLFLAWGVVESLLAYASSARQERLGLATRLQTMRFQFWSVSGSAILLFLLILISRDVLGTPRAVVRAAQPILALIAVSAMWLTFFPPHWMEERYAGVADGK